MDLRSATLPELLAFGAQYPELQRRVQRIIALGSEWRSEEGGVYFPILSGDDRYRDLGVIPITYIAGGDGVISTSNGGRWHPVYRFLAVRK